MDIKFTLEDQEGKIVYFGEFTVTDEDLDFLLKTKILDGELESLKEFEDCKPTFLI